MAIYFSGCNLYINTGDNPDEPIGTATSMHECTGCSRETFCQLRQTYDIFPWNEQYDMRANCYINMLKDIERQLEEQLEK